MTEYFRRYIFYEEFTSDQIKNGYLKILQWVSSGVVIFRSDDNSPLFCNHFVSKIAVGNTAFENTSGILHRDSYCESGIKTQIIEAFKNIIQLDQSNSRNLMNQIEEWVDHEEGLENEKKFTCKIDGEDVIFGIRMLKIFIDNRPCKVAILHDISAYDNLSRLSQKYNNMFINAIMHDIRTPLHSIFGMLEIIQDCSLSEPEKVYITVAKNACKILTYLLNDITDYSQLESKALRVNNEKVAIRGIIEELKSLMEFNFQKKNVQQIYEISEQVPMVMNIDKTRFTQVFLNILLCSLKMTFEGQVKVVIDYDSHNDLLMVLVRDTGIGIKPEDLQNIFKIFGSINAQSESNQAQAAITNFGLAVGKQLCEYMGGYLAISSRVSYGTNFSFAVKANCAKPQITITNSARSIGSNEKPIKFLTRDSNPLKKITQAGTFSIVFFKILTFQQKNENEEIKERIDTERPLNIAKTHEQAVIQKTVQPESSAQCNCPQILIVDDSDTVLFVLENYLKSIGLQADEAMNGQDAINKLIERSMADCCGNYKLVIMDVDMPLMDGLEAARLIRKKIESGELPATPIVALSAGQMTIDQESLFFEDVHFAGYISKPIGRTEFIEILRNYGLIIKD